jgi:sulfite exporter TauE/SafE
MGNVYYSMLVMFSFGVGTFPLMLSLMLFGNNIPVGIRLKLKKITPIFVSIIACLLIIRGMNLNIPYVSPYMQGEAKTNSVSCH